MCFSISGICHRVGAERFEEVYIKRLLIFELNSSFHQLNLIGFSKRGMLKTKSSLFLNVTARELLFEGYTDALLTMGSFFAQVKFISFSF